MGEAPIMQRFLDKALELVKPRSLAAMALLLGSVAGQGGRGTMAYFTSTVTSGSNAFTAGVVSLDATGSGGGATSNVLGRDANQAFAANANFTWTTAAGGANCANTLTGTDMSLAAQRLQYFAPGEFCVAPITIKNTSANAVDSWMRVRLVRMTPTDSGGVNDALNNRLRFYMHEYNSTGTDNRATAQGADCNVTDFKPNASTSLGLIADDTDDTVGGQTTTTRTTLPSLGNRGKALGTQPATGMNAIPDLDLATVAGAGSMALAGGVGAIATTPTEAQMVTAAGAGRTAWNIIGDDEVSHPASGTSTQVNDALPANAELLASNKTRYYCAAIFFPSNTQLAATTSNGGSLAGDATNTGGDNEAQFGKNTYSLVITAAQKAGR